jgi:hypothetical protein
MFWVSDGSLRQDGHKEKYISEMNTASSENTIFSLPSDAKKAGQVFYGLMIAGVFFTPLVMFVYTHFIAPKASVTTKEFFVIFSALYILLFTFFSAAAKHASLALRKAMGNTLPSDVTIVAPTAANSARPEVVALGRKYWFWQLVNSYFSGIAFSWLGCIFLLFIN